MARNKVFVWERYHRLLIRGGKAVDDWGYACGFPLGELLADKAPCRAGHRAWVKGGV